MLIDFRQLFPRWNIKPKGVLHVGANRGEEAPIYNELGIKKVIWIEANEDIFKQLVNNIAQYPDQSAMCYCIGDEHDKPVTFHVSNNGSQSSSVLELGTHKIQHPEVHYIDHKPMVTKRIDKLFEDNFPKEIDFINLDVQGFEGNVLKGMGDLLHQIKWAYIEVNKAAVYEKCLQVDDIDFYLSSFGFRRVETARWIGDWSDALYVKG